MKQSSIMAIVLVVFILVAAAQTVELGMLLTKVKTANIGSSASSGTLAAGSSGAGGAPTSLSNLPQMVGGC